MIKLTTRQRELAEGIAGALKYQGIMKNAAVAVDDWKIPIFKKHLDAAGYKYEEPVTLIPGTSIIKVHYEWVHKLQPIIEAAQLECARTPSAQTKAECDCPSLRGGACTYPDCSKAHG